MNTKEQFSKLIKPKTTYGDTLRFTPYAYAKLIWMRDRGPTEVAGYCVTGTEDPLLVTDFVLIKQQCTGVTFDLDPNDGAEYVERMMDAGLSPWACSNILGHTHPGDSPSPSGVDETNFTSAFSHPDWAIMFIIAEGGKTYCRLKINTPPGMEKLLKVEIDWNTTFYGSDTKKWDEEYRSKVTEKQFLITGKEKDITWPYFETTELRKTTPFPNLPDTSEYDDKREGLQYLLDMDEICCYWDIHGNAVYYCGEDDTCYSYDPLHKKWYTENMFDDEGEMQEIETPQNPWVFQVIAWSEKHIDESNVLTER